MKDETKTLIRELEEEIKDLISENKKFLLEARALQDEVDSLWAMMDEMTKSDIENWTHILDEIKADVITRALMISKVKGEA